MLTMTMHEPRKNLAGTALIVGLVMFASGAGAQGAQDAPRTAPRTAPNAALQGRVTTTAPATVASTLPAQNPSCPSSSSPAGSGASAPASQGGMTSSSYAAGIAAPPDAGAGSCVPQSIITGGLKDTLKTNVRTRGELPPSEVTDGAVGATGNVSTAPR